MKAIEQFISPLIESQFPSVYREEGPILVAFVKAYYEWLESTGNVLYFSRKLTELRDIDKTVDEFIVHFKEQFLKNIKFDVATNKKLAIKNSLDLYRSKGTPRGLELFFKLVYGQPAKVYYPGSDLMRLSNGTWKKPVYIEVADTPYNESYVNREITGLNSGATAYVETIATTKRLNDFFDATGKKVQVSKDIHVLYLSNIKGSFQYGERITHPDIVDIRETTKIVGSLNKLIVMTGAAGYSVGDTVMISSNTAYKGKAVVTGVSDTTGEVDFLLIDGGWGYTLSPDILISERVLTVNNVITTSNGLTTPFTYFESLSQPKASILFTPTTGKFVANDFIYTYANNTSGLTGLGKIITIQSNSTQSNIYVTIAQGNIQSNSTFYNSDNSVSGSIVSYTDLTSTANMIAVSSYEKMLVSGISNTFVLNEEIYQANSTYGEYANGTIDYVSITGSNAYITLSNVRGVFNTSELITGRAAGSTASIEYYSTDIGILDTSTTSVYSVDVVDGGVKYSNSDVVQFISGTGSRATARLITDSNGTITSVVLKRRGSGYLTAPVVRVSENAQPFTFNANSDVSETTNFISIPNHNFINTEAVKYETKAGNTAIGGLVSGNVYYVRGANTSGISLAAVPKGTKIPLTKGLSESGHSITSVVSIGSGAVLESNLGNAFDFQNETYVRGLTSNSSGLVTKISTGSLASFRVASLDDEEPVEFYTDYIDDINIYGAEYLTIRIDGDITANTALSGSEAYGFPAYPTANLTHGTLEEIFAVDEVVIGSISRIVTTNPGEDYNTDPLVTVVEMDIYKNKKRDYILVFEEGDADNFTEGENLQRIARRRFDGQLSVGADYISIDQNYFSNVDSVSYLVDYGNTAVGGLSASEGLNTYYVVEANSSALKLSGTSGGPAITLTPSPVSETGHYLQHGAYAGFGILKEKIDKGTIRVTRTSLFTDLSKDVGDLGDLYIKGETSGAVARIHEYKGDITFSGFNADVEANVITAVGSVVTLKVVDSGFGYGNFEIVSFKKEGDPEALEGLARALTIKEGTGEGFYQDTGSFLSNDKYLHDGEYYQEYSYDIITRVPLERYSEMLKKVLHVAGTKAFNKVEIESELKTPINTYSDISYEVPAVLTSACSVIVPATGVFTTMIQPGMTVRGTGISNSTVLYKTVISSATNSITLSSNATMSGTQTLTFN